MKNKMEPTTTVFDLETTGLVQAKGSDIITQPYMTEFFAIKVNSKYEVIKEFETYIKPPIPIPRNIEKMIGITNEMVSNAPTFSDVYRDIVEIFFGSHTVVAHNLAFDEEVLKCELRRIGKEYHFPYPPIKFCTVEQSLNIKGHRLKNGELYRIATGEELIGAHKARNDVMATFESFKWLRRRDENSRTSK